jgi:glycosyltransferase involved in cell wall biosynthesis
MIMQDSSTDSLFRINIVHCSSAHSRYDTRIFLKECRSLAQFGFEVSYLVTDGNDDEYNGKIHVCSVRHRKSRKDRLLLSSFDLYKKALSIDSKVYHFHDPELIPLGLRLKKIGKTVVFDCHESVSRQILSKPYIPRLFRKVVSIAYAAVEKWALSKFDLIIAATPLILSELRKVGPRVVLVNNFPIEKELASNVSYSNRSIEIAYIGGISPIRGVEELVKAMEYTKSKVALNLVGDYSPKNFKAKLSSLNGWTKIKDIGVLDREEVQAILAASRIGIVTFLPEPNHIESQPNKLFEYMSAGIPVIASDFPLWREIVESNNCGLCVDPEDPKSIAVAIDWLLEHPGEAEQMGKNGQRAVLERYNWENEARTLVDAYRQLLE